jgi:NADPH2:quinone reductase
MNKTRAIRFESYGGPEVLRMDEIILPELLDNEVRILHKAIGVNFIETYFRTGLYPATFPSGLGTEASGIVEAIGGKVSHLKPGDRVAYCQGPVGSYSERRNISAQFVVKIPDNVSFEQAASVMLKGLTVRYLFKDIHQLKKDETILFHAAAGGVGLIACQWAKHLGAKLIGTTSSKEKGEIAKSLGAWEVINYKEENISECVLHLTQGNKVPVVYDGVGKSTWEASLDCLRPRGLMVSFGNASGPVTGVNLSQLAQKGSLFVTRPVLGHYLESIEKLHTASADLFQLVGDGVIKTDHLKVYDFDDVRAAHRDLTERERVGGIVLLP